MASRHRFTAALGVLAGLIVGVPGAAAAPIAIRLDGVPQRLQLPLPEGANHILTVTITGGPVESVWVATSDAPDARRRELVQTDDPAYAINLGSRELLNLLASSGTSGELRVFAQAADGSIAESVPVRYAFDAVPRQLDFPFDEASMTIYQRSSKAIPGSAGRLRIHLGDITAGQVAVSIYGPLDGPLIDTTLMRAGDTLKIPLAEMDYVLRLDRLVNLIIGHDYGFFTLMPLDSETWLREQAARAVSGNRDNTSPPVKSDCGTRSLHRPAAWAQPMERPGLPNLHKVNDRLYRGAQPTEQGFAELSRMGVKTVVNLRTFHGERAACDENGLEHRQIRVQPWSGEEQDIVDFLRIVTDDRHHPVFVHCHHGADRTGLMCAIYRITVQGWSKEEAIREMTEGGYGFHPIWRNLIDVIRGLDVAEVERKMGALRRGSQEAPARGM